MRLRTLAALCLVVESMAWIHPTKGAADVLPLSDIFPVHEVPSFSTQSDPDILNLPHGRFWIAWSGGVPIPPPAGGNLRERTFRGSGTPRYLPRDLTNLVPDSTSHQEGRVLRLEKGRRAVVWTEGYGLDGSLDGIFAALYDRRMRRLTAEFQVNLLRTEGNQRTPTIAGVRDQFLVVWNDYGNDQDTPNRITAQLFDNRGRRIGEEFDLAVAPTDVGSFPEAIALPSNAAGDYLVAWESIEYGEVEARTDIAARFLRRDATMSERFLLNTGEGREEFNPSIARTSAGFVATWTAQWLSEDGIERDVYLRRFDSQGLGISDEERVNTYTDSFQHGPVVATSSSGNFIIAWTSGDGRSPKDSQDGDNFGLYAQAFASDGSRIGNEFQVSTRTEGTQGSSLSSTVATFVNDTDFVVAWESLEPDVSRRIYVRRFRLTTDERLCGDAVGADLTIDSTDALGVLRASVQLKGCALCSCDSNGSGSVEASDAQNVLRSAVGLLAVLSCPHCE
jgi:hypothetical protein